MCDCGSVSDRIAILIRRMMSRINASSHEMCKRYGFTNAQIQVMRALLHSGPMSAAALAGLLSVTPSNLTGVVDRLEAKGMLTRVRQEGDRRVSLLTLTDEGVRLAQRTPDPIEERVAASIADLDAEEIARISASLEYLVTLLERTDSVGRQHAPAADERSEP